MRLEAAGGAAIALQRPRRGRDHLAQLLRRGLVPLHHRQLQHLGRGAQARLALQVVEHQPLLLPRRAFDVDARLQQVDVGLGRIRSLQPLDGVAAVGAGQRAARVVGGDQRPGLRMPREQAVPLLQRRRMLAGARQALAGEQRRTHGLRRGLARALQLLRGHRRLAGGIGLQRQLAGVVCDARGEGAAAAPLEFACHFGGSVPVARALVQRQQGQTRLGVEGRALQRQVGCLGAVEQAGLHEIVGQRVLRALAFDRLQVGAFEQVLVHAHRALEVAAATEQVAQAEVQFGGVRVVLHRLDEGVDGLVLLLVEQQVQALEVGLRRLAAVAPHLAQVEARGHPAQREGHRQRDQQPLQLEVHGSSVLAGPSQEH